MLRSFHPRPVYNADGGDGGDPPPSNTMPEGLPAQYWDPQSAQVKFPDLIKDYTGLTTFKTEHDTRVAALPKTPDEYKFELKLPDTVKVPQGVELKLNDKDPRFGPVRAFAHKYQLPQDAINELVALEAQSELASYEAAETELQAEQKKLGENGPARVSAMESFLKANVSTEEYEALRPVLGSASAFAGLEKLIKKVTTQQVPGNTPPNGQQNTPPQPRRADRFYGNGKAT